VFLFLKNRRKKRKRQTKKLTIHQTKRIWCYCSHSSRRQNTAELERFAEPASRWTAMCITNRSSSVKILENSIELSSKRRFNDTFTSIQIDDEELYNQTKDYQEIAPSKQSIVKFYQSNDTPIFEKYNIERQIKTSLGKQFP
jgi:ribonuclease G